MISDSSVENKIKLLNQPNYTDVVSRLKWTIKYFHPLTHITPRTPLLLPKPPLLYN
jgi:hypothetical protein